MARVRPVPGPDMLLKMVRVVVSRGGELFAPWPLFGVRWFPRNSGLVYHFATPPPNGHFFFMENNVFFGAGNSGCG